MEDHVWDRPSAIDRQSTAVDPHCNGPQTRVTSGSPESALAYDASHSDTPLDPLRSD